MAYENSSVEERPGHITRLPVDVTGAALVVGGGVAGIQASLDLADSDFKVYLVEKKAGIGGVMAQLDKTFPTNDCSACILSPKLVTVGQNPNIEILAYSRVESLEGVPGNFRVKVRNKTRYIDVAKCKNCGDCADVCPVTLPDEYNERLNERKAAYRLFPQTIPQAFVIDKGVRAPCVAECPAGVNVQGYVQLVKQGKYRQAVELIMEKVPLPGVLGRVCPHPCEGACRRGLKDSPVSIRNLKRVAADKVDYKGLTRPQISLKEGKVAIVGSGPAGLSAAYYLALEGYACTIFESAPVLGGMLRLGIPEYRLPRDVLDAEIQHILSYGIEVRTNTSLGKDVTLNELRRQFNAVYLATGCHKGSRMDIAGEDSARVLQAVSFLRDVELSQEVEVGRSVAVIGGGNAALDAARTSLRLGAEQVSILYRRTRGEMPAWEEEIEAALEEDIKINFLVAPVEVVRENGTIKGLKCINMELGEPDSSGRGRPVPIQGSEFVFQTDMVISAIGQQIDPELWDQTKDLNASSSNTIDADPLTFETNIEGVFAGGDAASGPATVVEAVGAGHEAAISISRFLAGRDVREGRTSRREEKERARALVYPPIPRIPEQPREQPTHVQVKDRITNFSEVEHALSLEATTKEAERCLNCGLCSECMECVRACPAQAVNHSLEDEVQELRVGAVILAPGFTSGDPAALNEYGYGRMPNVVTGLEFERMLSASGPSSGHLERISDGRTPRKIAWIQCAGSRDVRFKPYCSSVCCIYAVKQAVIAREHTPGLTTHIFYMDLRAFGKEFEDYCTRAREEYGVLFSRSRVAGLEETDNRDLVVRYEENGRSAEDVFDLAVLSTGLAPPADHAELAEVFGFELNEFGFARTDRFHPMETTRPGVFVCGVFSGPKDIPDTVAQASGAASGAAELMAAARGRMVRAKEKPAEMSVAGQAPRIGVFVCHCGTNIGGVVDVPSVAAYARTLPHVRYAEDNLYVCSQDTQERIKAMIAEHRLNRVVVASCTPRTHESLFRETLSRAGLNPFLFEFVNIRDQCSWVHMHEPEAATIKAMDLLRIGVAKCAWLRPLSPVRVGVTPAALVIGGGLAGMTAALKISRQGFDVHLVEKDKDLGGILNRLAGLIDGSDPRVQAAALAEEIRARDNIHVYTQASLTALDGYIGNYRSVIRTENHEEVSIEHSVVVVATGGEQLKPTSYLYGEDPRVLTQLDLEERLNRGSIEARRVVMIGCVGSRQPGRSYCSRICCTQAVKNALQLKRLSPATDIYLLNRDMRIYGFNEQYYGQAREKGVHFIRYDPESPPVVADRDGVLSVTCFEETIGEELVLDADLVVLNVPVVPPESNAELARLLKVPLNKDGFFLEAHMKLRPVEFFTDGVFLCGLAHSPQLAEETIAQASGAATRACTVLARAFVEGEGMIAQVNETLCSGCGLCVEVCPYAAIALNESTGKAEVNPALCKCCGACAGGCRMGAIQQAGLGDRELIESIDALFEAAL